MTAPRPRADWQQTETWRADAEHVAGEDRQHGMIPSRHHRRYRFHDRQAEDESAARGLYLNPSESRSRTGAGVCFGLGLNAQHRQRDDDHQKAQRIGIKGAAVPLN
jgi:hypothetical protein